MSLFLLGQIVGFVAVALSLAEYQIDHRNKMLGLATAGALLYAASFFFIHAYTGAILNLIAAIRCYVFMKSRSLKDSTLIFSLFAMISTLGAALTWAGPLSLLALFGTLFSAVSSGQLSTKLMRRASLIAPPLWFMYNFVTRSYPGMFIEVFVVLSILLGQYRFDIKKAPYKTNAEV